MYVFENLQIALLRNKGTNADDRNRSVHLFGCLNLNYRGPHKLLDEPDYLPDRVLG